MTTFTERTGTDSPLYHNPAFQFDSFSSPALADLDGDGDLDMVVGGVQGKLKYFQNTGNGYTELVGIANPFNSFDVGSFSTPTFADVDGDNDLDVIVGESNGALKYFQNTGSSYTQITGAANPFNGIDVGNYSSPTFADVDGDNDLDIIVGESNGTLKYFQNTGSGYIQITGAANPFNGIDVGNYSSPTFADVDGDNDLDIIVGESNGTLKYFQNTGSGYTQITSTANPFNSIDVGKYSKPTFADVDGDNDLDVIVGESNSTLKYFENRGELTVVSVTGAGNMTVTGTASNNTLTLSETATTFTLNDPNQDLVASGIATQVNKDTVSLPITSLIKPVVINLKEGDDILDASGVATDLVVNGGTGNDTLTGGTGNDVLQGGSGADSLNGGDGDDAADYAFSSAGVNVSLSASSASGGDAVGDTFTSIESIRGSNFADNLTGDSSENTLLGRNGNDVLMGLDGNDVLMGGAGNDTLNGNADNDVLIGDDGDDVLNGGDGNDRLIGGAGADTYDGGQGNDTVVFDAGAARVTLNLSTESITTGDDTGKTIKNVENIVATDRNDVITGDSGSNRLYGQGGNDMLMGGDGNDSLSGGNGNDTLMGGNGNDSLSGGSGNDTLMGGNGNDRLLGGTGADSYDGGAGIDVVIFDLAAAGVQVNLSTQLITAGDDAGKTIKNVENIFATDNNDVVTGDGNDNRILGNGGNDTLIGMSGNDTLIGGDGNDDLYGGNGIDTLVGGSGSDTFRFLNLNDSMLYGRDKITDLAIGTDLIVGPNAIAAADIDQLGSVAQLSNAALQSLLTGAIFEMNTAATFTYGSRTYLAINDSVAGFSATDDAVIEITGFTGSLANLAIANLAIA